MRKQKDLHEAKLTKGALNGPTRPRMRRLGIDHHVRLAVSLVAMAAALLLALLSSPELPSAQAVDVPALQAKS
jgi:hypothetical protein